MHIERIDEFAISPQAFTYIHALLRVAFEGYPASRPYFKLRPHFRYLAWDGGTLAGHLAVDHRVIRVGSEPLSIFGIIDVCVAPAYQRRGLATQLLHHVEALAQATERDALVLFADDDRLYTANGYQRVDAVCRWMMIDDHRTLGIAEQSLGDCMMTKLVSRSRWPDGIVDMLGYLF